MDRQRTVREHATFRTVLKAMSSPGTIESLPDSDYGMPLLVLLSTLLDNEVSLSAIGEDSDALLEAVARATGCRRSSVSTADFVLVTGGSSAGKLTSVRRGTAEYPETGATVIYLLDELAAEGGTASLSGPGIETRVAPLLSGLNEKELQLLGEINRDFPLGIDAICLDRKGKLICIPRSTGIGVN